VYVRQVQTRQRYELRCTDDLDHRWIVEVGQILRDGRSPHADIFSGEAERHSRVVKKLMGVLLVALAVGLGPSSCAPGSTRLRGGAASTVKHCRRLA